MTPRTPGPLAPALVALLATLAVGGCRGGDRDEPTTSVVEVPVAMPEHAFAWVGDAPVWIRIDLAELRDDPRLERLWELAGPSGDDGALGASMARAETLVVAWRDPTFSERLNILTGDVDPAGVRTMVEERQFTGYVAGRGTVWTHAAHPWAVALPSDRVLLTGAPEAVRAATASPCASCRHEAAATVEARFDVTDMHRRIAAMMLDSDLLDRTLAATRRGEATLDLALGADLRVALHAVEGADLTIVGATLAELLEALRTSLGANPDTAFVGGLMQRARLDVRSDAVELSWELSRDEVDALIALLAVEELPFPVPETRPAADGSGEASTDEEPS